MLLDQVFPETLALTLTQKPYLQSQDDTWSIRDLVFVDYDLFVGLGGGALFHWGGNDYLVEEGTALLVPPGQPLRAEKVSREHFEAVAQHFELQHLGTTDFFDQFQWRPLVKLTRWPVVQGLLEAYVGALRTEGPGSSLVGHALFRAVLLEFARDAWEGDRPPDPRHGFVFRMARTIERLFRDEDAVDTALASAPVSADYAGRLFRKQFGLSPSRYQTRCRVRTAVDLLSAGSSVKEAAHDVGYADQLYFSRVFTKWQGVPPSAYQPWAHP